MNLFELVESGDSAGVLRELGAMTLEQRAAQAADLGVRREAMRTRGRRHEYTPEREAACSIGELACQTTPETAAAWLTRRGREALNGGAVVDATNLYPAEWRAELVAHLAGQQVLDGDAFIVAEHVIRDTGCPLPTSDAFITAWLHDRSKRDRVLPSRATGVLSVAKDGSFLEQLRKDDFTPALLPLAVARPAIDISAYRPAIVHAAAKGFVDRGLLSRRVLADLVCGTPAEEDARKALEGSPLTSEENARLAVARRELVEGCIARLLQDGTHPALEETLSALRALAPTPAENAAFLRDHVAMLDLSSPVAVYGQEALAGLDEAGLLEADVRTEACERVLLRPEKKLVRAQLSWLDRAARRDPAQAGHILVDAAAAFQHPDVALQERALNLIARRLRSAGGEALPELRAATGGISPGLAARAVELLGLPQDTGAAQYVEVLPPVPESRPVPGPIATAAETAQEVAAVLADPGDVVAFERALDGLVRHARLDRSALSEALKPVIRKEPRIFRSGWTPDWTQADLEEVAVAVRGDDSRYGRQTILRAEQDADRTFPRSAWDHPAGDMLHARLSEVVEMVDSGTQPFLLALPTLATGAIAAAVLVERIAEFERLGITPAPVDLAQALLRVAPDPGEQVRSAAEELRSDAGQRLARWLRDGGLARQDSTPKEWPVTDPTSAPPGWWEPATPGLPVEPPLPPVAAALVENDRRVFGAEHAGPCSSAQLPHHRDEVAASIDSGRWRASAARFGMDAGGPAGFGVHWHVAHGLPELVDPFLMLAAQGRLDSGLLAGQVQALMRHGVLGANRVTATLRTAAETGAYATVWSVLEALLPPLLRGTPVRGAGAFLALAVECASRCGATGPIPEVEAVAERKGSTQTVKNARLLRDALR